MATSKDFTVGYFPTTMPRDPVDIDIFVEHLGVGQVLETLVQVSSEGEIVPNLAKSWKIQNNGTKFNFLLNENISFSNGKNLDCEDVVFSIKRHMNSNSQSTHYFKNINDIQCIGKYEIEFNLKSPQVSFLKILTRDHLGILPKGWTFDKNKKEPWIGTGAYRYLHGTDGSFFVKNNNYRFSDSVKIDKWKVLSTNDVFADAPKLASPDLILHITSHIKKSIELIPALGNISFDQPMHFSQTSIWWYPLGNNYEDESLKQNTLSIMNELVLELNKHNKLELASGVVPRGIQGHLLKRMNPYKKAETFKKQKLIKVSVYSSDFSSFFGNDVYKAFEKKYNFKFDVSTVSPVNNAPEDFKPDILIANYAGGFSDPDGFLIVLGSILGVEPNKYLGNSISLYKEASMEQDWTKRGEKFRKINELLVNEFRVVPAWKKEIYIGKSSRLIDSSNLFGYSVRLSRFKPK